LHRHRTASQSSRPRPLHGNCWTQAKATGATGGGLALGVWQY